MALRTQDLEIAIRIIPTSALPEDVVDLSLSWILADSSAVPALPTIPDQDPESCRFPVRPIPLSEVGPALPPARLGGPEEFKTLWH